MWVLNVARLSGIDRIKNYRADWNEPCFNLSVTYAGFTLRSKNIFNSVQSLYTYIIDKEYLNIFAEKSSKDFIKILIPKNDIVCEASFKFHQRKLVVKFRYIYKCDQAYSWHFRLMAYRREKK